MRARREFRRWLGVVVLLYLATPVLVAAVPQAVARSRTFTLVGTVVDDAGKPVTRREVDVTEIDREGAMLFRVGPDGKFRGLPGYGKTDEEGPFRVQVDRTHFGLCARICTEPLQG